jgi:ubiquinone/menaquinone biosynthesis C-methylase UbiE
MPTKGEKKERYWSRYACTYDDYTDYVVGRNLRQAIVEKLLEEHELGEIVEFGCGTGYYTRAIARRASHVLATDLSDEMLEIAHINLRGLHNVTLQKVDCENSSFPAEKFDTVFMANVIHTIENPLKTLHESHRILKERGLLLIITYTDYGLNWFEKMELSYRYFLTFGAPPTYGLKNFSPQELHCLVADGGFTVGEVQLLGDKPRALYLKGRKQETMEPPE